MRILIAGPPKTGNVWIESILSTIYRLEILKPPGVPGNTPEELQAFIERGLFPENAIFHQHYLPTEDLFRATESIGCRVVTTVRNPYDTFVSLYHYIQAFRDDFIRSNDVGRMVIDKPTDHPAVLEFLEHGFRCNLISASEWRQCPQTLLVRYEDLHADAFREVKRLTALIKPVDDSVLREGVAASTAEAMRGRDAGLAKHIRSAKVGNWKQYLNSEHLRIFSACHGDLIRRSGYEVEPADVPAGRMSASVG